MLVLLRRRRTPEPVRALSISGRCRNRVSSALPQTRTDVALASAGKSHLAVMLAAVAAPVLILDQLSKHLVSAHLALFRTVPLIPGWLDLTYTLNPGAAFSLF